MTSIANHSNELWVNQGLYTQQEWEAKLIRSLREGRFEKLTRSCTVNRRLTFSIIHGMVVGHGGRDVTRSVLLVAFVLLGH